ncbi:SpoIIE family protein phosphatase [Actinotalea ferrariae]|uniref:SpoIIE family protein phosphatase n=1 Tax=Actinotalea ferrariae TaxID=1386098 RepID=UPI001C8C372A|nr:SpoIIE family protein phosphatase [Actinotalea ferrariae]MBX9245351.1 SpoIIE family protein phosphatase [Actinotalea ferrariae]
MSSTASDAVPAGPDATRRAVPRPRRTLTLPPEPASAERVRRWLRDVLTAEGRPDCADAAELACTELVTNAVLHAHTDVDVVVAVGAEVRVEVRDTSPALPEQRGQDTHATTGRGLALVAAVSDDHGVVDAGPGGKTLWFTVGGDRPRTPEEALAAWDVEDLVVATAADAAAADGVDVRTVHLLGLPPMLWMAARDHHDTLLRELVLYAATHDLAGADPRAADQARAHLVPSVVAAIDRAHHESGRAAPSEDRASLPSWAPAPVDVDITVPVDAGHAFSAMQHTLEVAEHLARTGRLLARPGIAEVVALRDWLCGQVVAQLDGAAPARWAGFDDERFELEATDLGPDVPASAGDAIRALVRQALREAVSDPVLDMVRGSVRGVMVVDERSRIVAVSRPLADATGWDADGLVGRRFVALLPPRMREAYVAGFMRHLTTGATDSLGIPLLLPVRRSDGTEIACRLLIEPSSSATGRPLYLAWIEPVAVAPPTARSAAPLDVDHVRLFRSLLTPYLVMSPELVVVEANDAYLRTVGRTREELVGRDVFELFPPTRDALDATGVSRIQRSLERARDTGRPDTMPLQRYDIPDLVHGGVVERHWSLISIPVLGDDGRTVLVAQRAEDVTDFVQGRGSSDAERDDVWRRRLDEVQGDLYARARELAAAVEAKEVAARRLAALAAAAFQLTSAETVADLEEVVVGHGLRALGADGGCVATEHPEGGWRVSASGTLPDGERTTGVHLPRDSRWPAAWCARTGTRLLLPTRASAAAFYAPMDRAYEDSGRTSWAFLPLRLQDQTIGSLGVAWTDEHHVSPDELEVLEAFAAQLAQALERIRATQAQRVAAAEAQRLSETLQRSMLTRPPRPPGLDIAVRYQPAAQQAKVGGDWYDAFVTSSGATLVVVGDVSGHDRKAAALMGQVRNLLRGIAYDSHSSPAAQLTRLDAAMHGLELATLATAVLGRLEQSAQDRADHVWRLRWSNAGHLAPLVRTPDGDVRLVDDRTDLLLGLDPTAPRAERMLVLTPGTTLVLYTDGLVERRGESIDVGVERLVRVVRAEGGGTSDELAEAIVAELGPESRDDDLALLVVTVAP